MEKKDLQDYYSQSRAWGLSVGVDLKDCDKALIKNEKYIEQYIADLIKLIDMRAYGLPLIVRFGDNPKVGGYTMMQLIETSSIVGHFVDESGGAYLDIFSCKFFDPQKVLEFSQAYFKAIEGNIHINFRR